MAEQLTFGLIGESLGHSLSPGMHRAGFSALGMAASYELCRVPKDRPDLVEAEMRRLASMGGGNVTVPHKAVAARVLDRPTETVTALGACNCFWEAKPGVLAGDNTDVSGIRQALEGRLANRRPEQVLILGAGGAAAAAGLASAQLGTSDVRIHNRTFGRAVALAERMTMIGVPASAMEGRPSGRYDIVINATPLGVSDSDPLPMSFDRASATLVLDLVYGRRQTVWTRAAGAAGIEWVDGREVLLLQGVACYPLWFGVEAPVLPMRRAVFREDN